MPAFEEGVLLLVGVNVAFLAPTPLAPKSERGTCAKELLLCTVLITNI